MLEKRGWATLFETQVMWAVLVAVVLASPANARPPLATAATGSGAHRASGAEGAAVSVMEVTRDGLVVTVEVGDVVLEHVKTAGGEFTAVMCAELPVDGADGSAALPVVRRLVVVPRAARVSLSVETGETMVRDLLEAGYPEPVVPYQPPVPMSPEAIGPAALVYDEAAYERDEWLPAERATITELGLVRGHRLALLEVRPIAYNAARHLLSISSQIRVGIRFDDGDPAFGGRAPLLPRNGVVLNAPVGEPSERGSGNYLVVVASAYSTAIDPFVAFQGAQGYTVTKYSVAPGTTNTAIRNYIMSLAGTPDEPDYILLVGDSDTIPAWTGGGARASPTDLPYACFDTGDDWYPDASLGRFSVRSTTDVQTLINKTTLVAGGVFDDPKYVERAVFMAGTDANSGDEAAHNLVIDSYMLPNGISPARVYKRTYGATTEDTRLAFDAGCVWGVYYGHSWSDMWQDGPAFSHADVQGLLNNGMYGFLFHFTCTVGRFSGTTEPCFTERWTRVANKGVAATYGTTNYIYYSSNPGWPETANLYQFVFRAAYEDGRREIGDAWQTALYELLATYGPANPVCRDYFEMFNLLGDPALRVPEPYGFSMTITPLSRDVCTAVADSASYTVEVFGNAGFADPVTLTATGTPAGASVTFSVNSVPPPYTSVMTVGNLSEVAPREYAIEVKASTPGLERFKVVRLGLWNAAPAAFALLSPPNGAVDVSRYPIFTWEAAWQAVTYDLQVATDAGFTNVVHTATTDGPTYILEIPLPPSTVHYWRVRAENVCGQTEYCAPFSFTTIGQADYFTEQFGPGQGAFDLDGLMVTFAPDGSGDYYVACVTPITELPTDPSTGFTWPLSDDGYFVYMFPHLFTFYGHVYSYGYVNANGNMTFLGHDQTWNESLEQHFGVRRISALFDDLNPEAGGAVMWHELDDHACVTWLNVPEYNTSNQNTFQMELYFASGEIRLSYLGIAASDGIVGLSAGYGLPLDFIESDLSAYGSCSRIGDMNCDGNVDFGDINPFVLAMLGEGNYYAYYPDCDWYYADCNQDGVVNFGDINAFVVLLTGR